MPCRKLQEKAPLTGRNLVQDQVEITKEVELRVIPAGRRCCVNVRSLALLERPRRIEQRFKCSLHFESGCKNCVM